MVGEKAEKCLNFFQFLTHSTLTLFGVIGVSLVSQERGAVVWSVPGSRPSTGGGTQPELQ